MTRLEIEHTLAQILPNAEAVRSSAGELLLDGEMRIEVEKTLRQILKKRLKPEKKKPHF
jgi:hypothetical protein